MATKRGKKRIGPPAEASDNLVITLTPGVPSTRRKGNGPNVSLVRNEAGDAGPERKRLPEKVIFRLFVSMEGSFRMSVEFPLNECPELTVVVKYDDEKTEYNLPRGDLEDIINMILSCRIPLVPMVHRAFGLMDGYTIELMSGTAQYRFNFFPALKKEPDPFTEIIISLTNRLSQLVDRWDVQMMSRHLRIF